MTACTSSSELATCWSSRFGLAGGRGVQKLVTAFEDVIVFLRGSPSKLACSMIKGEADCVLRFTQPLATDPSILRVKQSSDRKEPSYRPQNHVIRS